MPHRWMKDPKILILIPLMCVLLFAIACGGSAAEPVIVEREVTKEVVIEKEVFKEVIKEVPKEVIVEKEVIKEVKSLTVAVRKRTDVMLPKSDEIRPGIVIYGVRVDGKTLDDITINADHYKYDSLESIKDQSIFLDRIAGAPSQESRVLRYEFRIVPESASRKAAYRTKQTNAVYMSSADDDYIELLAPAPEECDTDNPVKRRENFKKLSDLEPQKSDTYDIPGGIAFDVEFTNKKGQRFKVTVIGKSKSVIDKYLADANLCAEALGTAQHAPQVPESNSTSEKLLEVARSLAKEKGTANSLWQFVNERRNQWDAGLTPTLESILASFNVTLAEVMATAETGAQKFWYPRYLDQPDAPILHGASEVIEVDNPTERYTQILANSNDGVIIVVIEVEDITRQQKGFSEVYSIVRIDPSIDQGQPHYYQAMCARTAVVRIRAKEKDGKQSRAAVIAWLAGYPWNTLGIRIADTLDDPTPRTIYESFGETRTFDAGVTGLKDDSYYDLGAEWHLGSGTENGCP